MSMRSRKLKILVSVALVVLLWWFVFRHHPKPDYTTCGQLFANVHKHIVQNAFDEREEAFTAIWASTSALEKEACSYYSFYKEKDSVMIGYKSQSGEYSNRYLGFTKGEEGIISYYSEKDPKNILGYFYPLFFDDFGPGLGFVDCTDKNGFAEWKANIGVPMIMIHHHKAKSMVREGIETFQRLAPLLGVDIHQGDFYTQPCWKPPTWSRPQYSRRNDTA